MGKEKYLNEINQLFSKTPVVELGSIKRLIKNKKGTEQYAKQLIRRAVLKGEIKKLTRKYYTMFDDVSLAVFCFKPSYLGLQDALSMHNLWEQETIPVIITTQKIRPGIRKILGVNVLIRRIEKKYLFGFDYYKQGNFYLPYSNLEKTFIDMVYFKENLNSEVLGNILSIIDKKKLKTYLRLYPKKFRERFKDYLQKIDN